MKKIYLMVILFLVILGVGCQKNIVTVSDPLKCERSVKSWVESEFRIIIRNEITKEVNQQYPNLPNQEKESLIADKVNQMVKNDDIVEQLVDQFYKKYCGNEKIDDTTEILTQNGFKVRIRYSWNDRLFTGSFSPDSRDSMEWIKDNLPKDAVISSWWDYGHMIRAIGKRNAVVFNPSEDILGTVASVAAGKKFNTKESGELSDHEDIKNVALILTTTNPSEAINLMQNYNSKYLLVTTMEYDKSNVIYNVSKIEYEIVDSLYHLNNESIMVKMLKLQPIEGFEVAYSDSTIVIYKLKES